MFQVIFWRRWSKGRWRDYPAFLMFLFCHFESLKKQHLLPLQLVKVHSISIDLNRFRPILILNINHPIFHMPNSMRKRHRRHFSNAGYGKSTRYKWFTYNLPFKDGDVPHATFPVCVCGYLNCRVLFVTSWGCAESCGVLQRLSESLFGENFGGNFSSDLDKQNLEDFPILWWVWRLPKKQMII